MNLLITNLQVATFTVLSEHLKNQENHCGTKEWLHWMWPRHFNRHVGWWVNYTSGFCTSSVLNKSAEFNSVHILAEACIYFMPTGCVISCAVCDLCNCWNVIRRALGKLFIISGVAGCSSLQRRIISGPLHTSSPWTTHTLGY